MSRLSRREQLASHLQDDKEEAVDYRQLYLECKKNVALFMQHVDSELSTILASHEKEKNALKAEVDRLRLQLRQQEVPQPQPFATRTPAHHHRRNNSDSRSNYPDIQPKEVVEINLLQNFDARSLCSERKEATDCSFNEEKRVSFRLDEEEKENLVLTGNLETDCDVSVLKGVPSARRERREKKPAEALQKADNIKDLLKGIRGKFSSKASEQTAPCVNIISPGMFTARN
jgi:hypothetical protein